MIACLYVSLCIGLAQAQRIVDTEYGEVRGHVVNVNNGIKQTTVDVFHGIPYAKNTSGARRFLVNTHFKYNFENTKLYEFLILSIYTF